MGGPDERQLVLLAIQVALAVLGLAILSLPLAVTRWRRSGLTEQW